MPSGFSGNELVIGKAEVLYLAGSFGAKGGFRNAECLVSQGAEEWYFIAKPSSMLIFTVLLILLFNILRN